MTNVQSDSSFQSPPSALINGGGAPSSLGLGPWLESSDGEGRGKGREDLFSNINMRNKIMGPLRA